MLEPSHYPLYLRLQLLWLLPFMLSHQLFTYFNPGLESLFPPEEVTSVFQLPAPSVSRDREWQWCGFSYMQSGHKVYIWYSQPFENLINNYQHSRYIEKQGKVVNLHGKCRETYGLHLIHFHSIDWAWHWQRWERNTFPQSHRKYRNNRGTKKLRKRHKDTEKDRSQRGRHKRTQTVRKREVRELREGMRTETEREEGEKREKLKKAGTEK